MRRIIILLLILCSAKCQESAQYLQNAVRDLRRLNYRQTLRRADTLLAKKSVQDTPMPILPSDIPRTEHIERRAQHGPPEVVPTLGLTKGELAALYENAIAKGETLKLDTGENSYIHAAVHELDGNDAYPPHHDEVNHVDHLPAEDSKNEDGYYYYYYPIKSFIDHISGSTSVTIRKERDKMEEKNKKGLLEPIFMAVSGFVGMAVMFVISMIIIPKLGSKPKKSLFFKNPKDIDMDELARLALNAIDRKDCRDRFACELVKITVGRNFNFEDNRFVKLLKRIAPGAFGQIDRIGRYGDRQLQCTLIPCTRNMNIKIQKVITKKPPTKKKNVAQKKH
ncbi:uncharacterized protein LOC114324994 isoform X2 [Diabrotica virgifera virgifera]|uniref:Uncharacterized protein n=1 Tax=Diabrotica virgifera virgifera TaxID=50390 RepID=A0ABM5LAJ3_DIAVI|nr:uncharacterized protein LOC114324994 isoform X2 [Diabrotica virgifera virgifera]